MGLLRAVRALRIPLVVCVALALPPSASALLIGVHHAPGARSALEAQKLDETEAAAVRAQIDWSVVQAGGREQWDWSEVDAAFAHLADRWNPGSGDPATNGIRPNFATLVSAPDWAARGNANECGGLDQPLCVPRDGVMPEWREFMRKAQERYGTTGTFWSARGITDPSIVGIVHWGIWNEPNHGKKWNGDPSTGQYADLVQSSRAAIDTFNSNNGTAHKVAGVNLAYGPGPEPPQWMKQFANFHKSALAAMDSVAIHLYLAKPDLVVPAARSVKNLDTARITNIAVTEMGWSIADKEGYDGEGRKCVASEAVQANHFDSATRDVANNAPIVTWLFWFNAFDKDSQSQDCAKPSHDPDGQRFGLYSDDKTTPKQVHSRFTTLAPVWP